MESSCSPGAIYAAMRAQGKINHNNNTGFGMLRCVTGLCLLIMAGISGGADAQSLHLDPGGRWTKVDLTRLEPGNGAGVNILAKNVTDDSPSADAVGRTRQGIGAAGAQASAPAIKAETGFDPIENRSEQIIILFDEPVSETEVDVAYFHRNEEEWDGISYHEQGGWRAYRDTVLIEEGRFLPPAKGGEKQIAIRTRAAFDRLEMFATPYVSESGQEIEPGVITTDSSDFLIKRISYKAADRAQNAKNQ